MANTVTQTMLVTDQIELDLSGIDPDLNNMALNNYAVAAPTWSVNNTGVALAFMDQNNVRVLAIGRTVGTSIVTATWVKPGGGSITATYTITVSAIDPTALIASTTNLVPQNWLIRSRGRGLGSSFVNY